MRSNVCHMNAPGISLIMRPMHVLILFCVCVAVSCSNHDQDENELLSEAPYRQLTDSIKRFPRQADLDYRRGALLYSNNNMKEAEADLRTAWQLQPDETHALSLTTMLRQKNT